MNVIELWIRDEYGQASILDRSSDLPDLIKKSLVKLESENFDNALTSEETYRNWSCYLPVVAEGGKMSEEFLYSGSLSPGKYNFLNLSGSGVHDNVDMSGLNVRVLLGYIDGEYKFAKDHKNKEINKLDSDHLRLKSFLFFKEKK